MDELFAAVLLRASALGADKLNRPGVMAECKLAGGFCDLLQVHEFFINLLQTGDPSSPTCCSRSLKWVLASGSDPLGGILI